MCKIVHMDNDRDDRDDDYWGSSLDSDDADNAHREFFDQLWSSSDDNHEHDAHPLPGCPDGVVIEATILATLVATQYAP